MPTLTQDGIAIIKKYEGFSPTQYTCPAGKPTIGYGHLIRPGEVFTTLTEEQGEQLLRQDCQAAEDNILSHITAPLNDNQFSALVSLVYNEGTMPLLAHLGQYLNQSRYDDAATEFDKWIFSDHQPLPGLIKRRREEKSLFLAPVSDSVGTATA